MSGLRGRLALAVALLLMLCCLGGAAAAQEPAYASTRAFAAMLRQAQIPFEAQGVDEYGDDCLMIPLEGVNLYGFFTSDGTEVCFIAWYVIEYAPGDGLEVMQACNRLNAASDGPRFCADESDRSVTAMLDVVLPWNGAGEVAWRGFRSMEDMLQAARQELRPMSIAPVETPAPTPVATAAPSHVVTPVPTAAPTATPAPTATASPRPAPTPDQPSRVTVVAATARVRSGPGVTSPYLFTARQGDQFPVIGVSGDWYIITSNGRTGFISREAVTPVP